MEGWGGEKVGREVCLVGYCVSVCVYVCVCVSVYMRGSLKIRKMDIVVCACGCGVFCHLCWLSWNVNPIGKPTESVEQRVYMLSNDSDKR